MEIQDGFIVGIFNYCDGWCVACAFTSRCRLFADKVEMEARQDPGLKALVEAPPLPQDLPRPLAPWMEELIEEMNEAARDVPAGKIDIPEVRLPPAHEALSQRTKDYLDRVYAWLSAHEEFANVSDPRDPRAVVGWFHMMIHVQTMRALHGLAEDDPAERGWPADYDGSAKVVLVAVERSHTAWLAIVARGMASWSDVEMFVRQLLRIRDEVERVFPKARAFVRPGLDEPEEVAKLIASEGA
jgi:hypothetical protein